MFNLNARSALLVTAICLLSTTLFGCNSQQSLQVPAAEQVRPDLSWPPAGEAVRATSDDTVNILGREASQRSFNTQTLGDTLKIVPTDEATDYAYGIFILDGFTEFITLGGATVDYGIVPGTPGDGTALYLGLANYELERWEWLELTGTQQDWTPATPADYTSDDGETALALVATGPGHCLVNWVEFARVGDTGPPPTPTGLAAVIHFPSTRPVVELSWDNMGPGINYNVYRATFSDLSDSILLTAEPVAAATYADETVFGGRDYYFYVTSIIVEESTDSDDLYVRTPQIDWVAPQNFRVNSSGFEEIEVTWDWGFSPPDGFRIYRGNQPDFKISEASETQWVEHWEPRLASFSGLTPGKTYYFLAHVEYQGKEGYLTDHLAGQTAEPDVEVIGPGTGPLEAIVADGEISVAYVSNATVMLGRRDGGNWSSESTTLDASIDTYGQYLDLYYENDQHILAFGNGDLNVALGNPGSGWAAEFVADGTPGEFQAPVAGQRCRIAADSTEISVAHLDHYGGPEGSVERGLIHTRLWSGGGWSESVTRNGYPSKTYADSPVLLGGNLYLASYDLTAGEFKFGDRTGGYSWTNINNGISSELGSDNDMTRLADEFQICAYDYVTNALYFIAGDGTDWDYTPLASHAGSTKMGLNCRIDQHNGEPLIYFNSYTPEGTYLALRQADTWIVNEITLPGVNLGIKGDVVSLGEKIYVVYEDYNDSQLKCLEVLPLE